MEYISNIQKNIVESNATYKLINGCAGSRKTDTLLKCAFYIINKQKCNTIFLTLIGSVTYEIKNRIQNIFNIPIHRIGNSNHFIGEHNFNFIEIANFDAFIHKQLDNAKEINQQNGFKHNLKVNLLTDLILKNNIQNFYLKNDETLQMILVDEFQDLEPSKVDLLLAIKKSNPNIKIFCVGDILQSIFSQTLIQGLSKHPMVYFKKCNPHSFSIPTCYRCPKAHLQFANIILQKYQEKFNVQPFFSNNNNLEDKPVLFTHGKLTHNTDAFHASRQICAIVKTAMLTDTDLEPKDVVILMKKTNENPVFECLKKQLKITYKKIGKNPNLIKHCRTQYDGYRETINWEEIKDKTKMMSIHAFKGRDAKLVIFLGLTLNCFPEENSLFQDEELIDVSLLNVALTRSTKYLFVGFSKTAPSRYISKETNLQFWKHMPKICYRSWVPFLAPPFYKFIIKENNKYYHDSLFNEHKDYSMTKNPNWYFPHRNTPLKIPRKDFLEIKNDLSREYEDIEEICPDFPEPITIKFGKKCEFSTVLDETMCELIGVMGELLISRFFIPESTKNIFENYNNPQNIYFTEDDRVLCLAYDLQINQYFQTEMHEILWEKLTTKYFKMSQIFLPESPKLIVPKCFSGDYFQKQLLLFLSSVPNHNIPTKVWWNVSIFYNEIMRKIYQPDMFLYLDCLEDDISILHENVNLLSPMVSKELSTQIPHNLTHIINDHTILENLGFNPNDNESIFTNGYHYGIRGFSDFYDHHYHNIIEVKSSHKINISMEWTIQTFLYSILPPPSITIKNLLIINILNGNIYMFPVPHISPRCVFSSILSNKKWKYQQFLITPLLDSLPSEMG